MKRLAVHPLGFVLAFLPGVALAQGAAGASNPEVQQRLNELKAMKKELQDKMQDFDARIRKLEAAEKEQAAQAAAAQKAAASQKAAAELPAPSKPVLLATTPASAPAANAPQSTEPRKSKKNSGYQPGRGFILSSGKMGEIEAHLIAYVRYLNQLNLDHSYTDSFGREKTLKLRQDVQFNKVNLSFRGWLFDPDFTYRAWIWTQQPAMGDGAQVVVAGQLGYHFNDHLNVYGGIAPLPSTRSTNWTYPAWLKMDNRTIADEFFRASYSQGFWADGKIVDDVEYRVMIANNLSALGVSASQLDAGFNTISGAVWWMPTTGEFGALNGFGDYEQHQDLATQFGVHYTRSRESAQEQAGVNDFENSQIRLSDGTQVFSVNAFNTPGQVNLATYQMADFEAGLKYQGFSLEGEYYLRWVNDFRTIGVIPVSSLFDQGYSIQASAMVVPKQLQAYVAGSQVLGEYGNPWDLSVGLNWFPFLRNEMHINAQAIYLKHSPVGGLSYPYIVGGNGWLFNTDFILTF